MKFIIVAIILTFSSSQLFADDAIDYQHERIEFASKENYQPYVLQTMSYALLEKHFKLAANPDTTVMEINQPLQQLADAYPLGIQVNYAIAGFLEYVASLGDDVEGKKGMLETAQKKKDKAKAILQSILSSGNGESTKTAFQVINILEEDAVLEHLQLDKLDQTVIESGNTTFDEITTKNKNGDTKLVYFDISIFHK